MLAQMTLGTRVQIAQFNREALTLSRIKQDSNKRDG